MWRRAPKIVHNPATTARRTPTPCSSRPSGTDGPPADSWSKCLCHVSPEVGSVGPRGHGPGRGAVHGTVGHRKTTEYVSTGGRSHSGCGTRRRSGRAEVGLFVVTMTSGFGEGSGRGSRELLLEA